MFGGGEVSRKRSESLELCARRFDLCIYKNGQREVRRARWLRHIAHCRKWHHLSSPHLATCYSVKTKMSIPRDKNVTIHVLLNQLISKTGTKWLLIKICMFSNCDYWKHDQDKQLHVAHPFEPANFQGELNFVDFLIFQFTAWFQGCHLQKSNFHPLHENTPSSPFFFFFQNKNLVLSKSW